MGSLMMTNYMNVLMMISFVYLFRNNAALCVWMQSKRKGLCVCVPIKWQLGYSLIGTSVEPGN